MNGKRTGWPEGMLQDDDRGLSRWLSEQPDARRQAAQVAAEIRADFVDTIPVEPCDRLEPNVGTELELDDMAADPATVRAAFILIGSIVFAGVVAWLA